MQREAEELRLSGKRIALVPTMGGLHEGHLSLVRKAQGVADVVIMSVYVNPTQFGPKEDFRAYPRPWKADRLLAKQAGVDIIFRPKSLYASDASTEVLESDLSSDRCGRQRPGHFVGVTTVVAKLFHATLPHVAIFGQKDGQQCDVIERMVRDLCMPVKILRAPIVRDRRGLAMSTRNQYLSADDYERACQFAQTLKAEGNTGGRTGKSIANRCRKRLEAIRGLEVEYVEWTGNRLYAAVHVGEARLIDNVKCVPGAKR